MNNHMGILFLVVMFLYKTYDTYKNKKDTYPFFVTSMIREEKNMDIDMSYKKDKKKIKILLQAINNKDEYDSPLIVLLPVEENYSDKLYEEYLKQAEDNPQKNSVKNVLKNILNRYDVIDQKIFLNKFSEEINAYLNLYQNISI
ncbi:conserved Plasmodium protein, unknown function [Plasmodium sp. gorilla clade G2]|uniref:conserved Plasmodium protein, unknown function n=1 Tax=Plasmodium sp. gorilla clade G2 TaxID=880535 RepID=UPI000D215C17|nr:conserved Plasmodium protein, unknown function [Plasmodium sp. gorilla clade G2]SOV14633.1 conserved Plasmodium protein, unknown function [Plasmodium sp. gorilla clade G2]